MIIKQMIKPHKVTTLSIFLALLMAFSLAACSSKVKSTFPNIDDANIPDMLEIKVGTLGNTSFSSGITDNLDYSSVLTVTFNDTTEMDYTTLMKHYQFTSTETGENDFLLFEWGMLQVTTDDNSISINALLK